MAVATALACARNAAGTRAGATHPLADTTKDRQDGLALRLLCSHLSTLTR